VNVPDNEGWKTQKENIQGFLDWHISKYDTMDVIHDIVCLGVFDKQSGEILGSAGIGKHDELHETEIFYGFTMEARGKGYATETAHAITSWAFETFDLPYIIGTAAVDNPASQRVLEKCGYTFINEQTLNVRILNTSCRFKYYRCSHREERSLQYR